MNNGSVISLEIFAQYEEVTYYTVKFENENHSETEKFFMNFMGDDKFKEDLDIISKKIERMGSSGCEERHFRREGKMKDGVCALPENMIGSKLRLYAIRLTKNIVILGNGGYKKTKTYNVDPFLLNCVTLLQTLDLKIKKRIRFKKITIQNNKLKGNLKFQL